MALLEGHHIRKVCAEDGHFDASTPESLAKIKKHIELHDAKSHRVLESMDIFGGHGNYERECTENGKSCKGIDVLYEPRLRNFLTQEGFFYIFSMMLTVVSRFRFTSTVHFFTSYVFRFRLFSGCLILFPCIVAVYSQRSIQRG